MGGERPVSSGRTRRRYGTHVNISGAGVLKNAPHRENAIRFLEYLASDEAQSLLRQRQQRVAGSEGRAVAANPVLASLGTFKSDPLPIATLGRNMAAAQRLLDRVGWK